MPTLEIVVFALCLVTAFIEFVILRLAKTMEDYFKGIVPGLVGLITLFILDLSMRLSRPGAFPETYGDATTYAYLGLVGLLGGMTLRALYKAWKLYNS